MYCKSLVFAKQKHTLGINWWGRSCSWYTGHIFTPVWRYHFLKTKISHLLLLITISPHLSIQYTNRYTDGKYVKGNATTTVAVEDRWVDGSNTGPYASTTHITTTAAALERRASMNPGRRVVG